VSARARRPRATTNVAPCQVVVDMTLLFDAFDPYARPRRFEDADDARLDPCLARHRASAGVARREAETLVALETSLFHRVHEAVPRGLADGFLIGGHQLPETVPGGLTSERCDSPTTDREARLEPLPGRLGRTGPD